MPYIDIETEVWVDEDDFDDDVLIEILKNRGYNTDALRKGNHIDGTSPVTLMRLFELKRLNSPAFDEAFSEYCWENLGRIVT